MEKQKGQFEYWFAALPSLSAKKKRKIREQVLSAEELYNIEEKVWDCWTCLTETEKKAISESKRTWDLGKCWDLLEKQKIRFVPYTSEAYPERLKHIADPPYALYVKGNLPSAEKAAAIVGARKNTYYGERQAISFAECLAEAGMDVISGLARGIDGYAHRGALQAGGKTFAVLAGGVDICYPREHIGLYMDILERDGGILSEQPPGTRPLAYYFPCRNRIISGLSDVVLVMEAEEKSGSLITADLALEQGKDVFALPGNLDSPLSKGCNRLIFQGAGILLGTEELCENLCIFRKNNTKKEHKKEIMLENAESLVYNRLGFAPKSLEELAGITKLSVPELTVVLVSLELKGLIKEIAKHHYVKK